MRRALMEGRQSVRRSGQDEDVGDLPRFSWTSDGSEDMEWKLQTVNLSYNRSTGGSRGYCYIQVTAMCNSSLAT